MKIALIGPLVLLALSVGLASGAFQQPNPGWKGIVPLRSTRVEVNRLLGKPEGECQCIYRTSTERVAVDYADQPCKGTINGWNVPKDTVLEFKLMPSTPKTFHELGLSENAYIETREEDTSTLYSTDLQLGIRYTVQDNHVVTLSYTPLRDDNNLRCAGFPAYDGGVTDYQAYDSFPSLSSEQTISHLDEFAYQLTTRTAFKGYIVYYAGRTSRLGEAKKSAGEARNYLVNKRRIATDRVFAIDGGFREKGEFELYLVRSGTLPPTPKPTLSSSEVIMTRTRRMRRRS